MANGVVKFYDENGGFGVISFEDAEYVFHKDSILDSSEVKEGTEVIFDLDNERNGLTAINIKTLKS